VGVNLSPLLTIVTSCVKTNSKKTLTPLIVKHWLSGYLLNGEKIDEKIADTGDVLLAVNLSSGMRQDGVASQDTDRRRAGLVHKNQ